MTSRYEISEKVSDRGTGEVFLAHDSSLERLVVLRFVTENVARECKAAAALDHPYICKIYEIGKDDGKPFIAMEYVRGETLEQRLARGALPLADVVRIASEVAEALETAHQQGIVHGDLKPSNIVLTDGGHVKVMHFGLAKTQDDDPRSDILSFGIVVNELAPGTVPERLERVIRKMMAKDPNERYQRVSDVRSDLARVRDEPAVRATSRLWLAAVAVVALLGLGAFLTDVLTPEGPPSVAVLPFQNVSDDPMESDYLAQGITRAVITKLTQAGLQVTPWDTARRYGNRIYTAENIAEELNVGAVLMGTFELVEDRIFTTLSLVDGETGLQTWAEELEEPFEDIFRVQRRIATGAATSLKRRLTGEEEAALAEPESQNVDAYDLYLQGAHLLQEGTREATEIALEYFERAVELDPGLAEAHVGVGAVETNRYYYGWGGGLENLERAEASYERALELRPDFMAARRGLIVIHYYRGRSERCAMEGLEAARYGSPNDVETLMTRALAYQLGPSPGRGVDVYREVLVLDPANQEALWRLVGNAHGEDTELAVRTANEYLRRFGDDPEVHMYVAGAHRILGNTQKAREHYEEATALSVDQTADAAVYGGILYEQLGEHERARELWKRAVDVFAPKLEESPNNRYFALTLASLYGLLGDEASMLGMEERALASREGSREVHVLAMVYAKRGEAARAVELLQQNLQVGFVYPWSHWFNLADVFIPASEAFDRFVEEHESETQRLREIY